MTNSDVDFYTWFYTLLNILANDDIILESQDYARQEYAAGNNVFDTASELRAKYEQQ